MSNLNELLAAVVLYSLFSYLLNLPDYFIGILTAVVGSQISTILPHNFKTSFLVYIPLIILSFRCLNITVGLIIGYSASIFICLLSKRGCKLLYPIKSTTFIGPRNYLENDTKGDYAATTFLIVMALVSVIFSLFGNTIVDTLNETSDPSYYVNKMYEGTNNNYSGYDNGFIQYINIDASDDLNRNVTTTRTNNTTTTVVSEYSPPK